MGSRRRNIFILVLRRSGLFLASLAVIFTPSRPSSASTWRAAPSSIYQGRPTPQNPDDRPARTWTARLRSCGKRVDQFGVAEPEISRDRLRTRISRRPCPTSTTPTARSPRSADTAQLYFYDWEPNVIPNPAVRADNGPTETPFAADLRRHGPARLQADSRSALRTSARPTAPPTTCSTSRVEGAAGRAGVRPSSDLFVDQPQREAAGRAASIVTVPQGTIVVQGEKQSDDPSTDVDESATPRWLLRAARPARADSGDRHHQDPEQPSQDPQTRTSRSSPLSFTVTTAARSLRRTSPSRIAERGLANSAPPGTAGNSAQASQYSGHFAVDPGQRDVVSRPIINYRRQPGRHRRPPPAPRSRAASATQRGPGPGDQFLELGALPIELKLISAVDRLGDARPAGARPRV